MLPRAISMPILVLALVATHGVTKAQKPGDRDHFHSESSSWLMYQHSADHNAIIYEKGLSVSWSRTLNGRVNGGLAITDGAIFVDTFAKTLYSVDLRSGRLRWSRSAENTLMSTPVIQSGLIYIGTGHNGLLSDEDSVNFYAPPPTTHELIWGRADGDSINAYSAGTGRTIWVLHTIGEDMPSPTILMRTLIFSNGDMHAYGVDPASGQVIWRHKLPGVTTMASATPVGGTVVLSTCKLDIANSCNTTNLEPITGRIRWQVAIGDSDCTPTVGDKRVFVGGVQQSSHSPKQVRGMMTALDILSGQKSWTVYDDSEGPLTTNVSAERAITATFADHTVYDSFPSTKHLVAIAAETGRVKWSISTKASIKMSPIVTRKMLFVGDTGGTFYILDSTNGHILSRMKFKSPFSTSPPVIVGHTLFIVNGSTLHAMNLSRYI